MATLWGAPEHTLPGRWARGYATAGGALAVGVVVGGIVGIVGAQTCTAEGFGCLGWLIGGLGLGILLAIVVFVVGALRAGLGVGHLLLLLLGWGVLAALAATVDNASSLFVVLGLLWPLAALYPGPTRATEETSRPAGSPGRTVLVVLVGVVVLAASSVVAVWTSEQGKVDAIRQSLAAEQVTIRTPADDEAYEWQFVINGVTGDGVSYALIDDKDRYWNVSISRTQPEVDIIGRPSRQFGPDVVTASARERHSLGNGVEDAEVQVFLDSLVPRSAQWTATRTSPLHRWWTDLTD